MFRILDLFCGAGGLSFGLEMNKKFSTLLAVDFDKKALDTFQYNFPNATIMHGDLTSSKTKQLIIKKSKELNINMVVGGPPCQGFSLKGKKLGLYDPRNFLFNDFYIIVKNIKPTIFLIENVKNLINANGGFFIKEIIRKFSGLGYKIDYKVLNALDFGVPQSRQRTFILGHIDYLIQLPNPKSETNDLKIKTIYDAISDLNYLDSGENSNKQYKNQPLTKYQTMMRNNSNGLYNHESTKHSALSIFKMSLIPEKGDKTALPLTLQNKQKFKCTWSRLHWNKPSPTIDTRFDTPSNGQNIHPILNRAITPREAARIQSFPDNFIFLGNKTSICKQIGNAVPPILAFHVANIIVKQT